jgi:hypothetical protein
MARARQPLLAIAQALEDLTCPPMVGPLTPGPSPAEGRGET